MLGQKRIVMPSLGFLTYMESLDRQDITECLTDSRPGVPPFFPPILFVNLEGSLSRFLHLLPSQNGLRKVPNVFVGDLRLRVKD